MTDNLEKAVVNQIKQHEMIAPGENIVVGVSGGKDSMALLTFLNDYSKALGFNLFAVHVNHMLRGAESERDKTFTIKSCEKMGIPCMAVDVDVNEIAKRKGIGTEEAGRNARYKIFGEAVRKFGGASGKYAGKVAVAHHIDDNVETVMLNLARGTGINGLRGMVPVSANGQITVIRPFLCVGRDDIDEYAKKKNIAYVEDSSNSSDDYARNKIRLKVIPEFQKVNSRVVEHINETSETLAMVQEYLDRETEKAFAKVADERGKSIVIDVAGFTALDPALQNGIIQKSIRLVAGTVKNITRIHIRDVISLAGKQTGRRIELPYGMVAFRSYGNIIIRTEPEGERRETDYASEPGHITIEKNILISMDEIYRGAKTLQLADGSCLHFEIIDIDDSNRDTFARKNQFTKVFDCDTIKRNLILGRAQADDEITIVGGKKSLRRFFVDEKVPWDIRPKVLVLKDMESTLWIIGYRIGEAYKITRKTTKALKVEIIGGNNE